MARLTLPPPLFSLRLGLAWRLTTAQHGCAESLCREPCNGKTSTFRNIINNGLTIYLEVCASQTIRKVLFHSDSSCVSVPKIWRECRTKFKFNDRRFGKCYSTIDQNFSSRILTISKCYWPENAVNRWKDKFRSRSECHSRIFFIVPRSKLVLSIWKYLTLFPGLD